MIYKAFTLSIFRKQKLKSKLSYKKPLKKISRWWNVRTEKNPTIIIVAEKKTLFLSIFEAKKKFEN